MWESLAIKNKQEYKRMILAFASLSEMFAQKMTDEESCLTPIINSKYQETVFQKVFDATPEDIGNTSYDASITLNDKIYLIGIKTFGYSYTYQKIAQFKACHALWSEMLSQIRLNADSVSHKASINNKNEELYKELALKIASVRNERIDSAVANIIGPRENGDQLKQESIYHVLMPSNEDGIPRIFVGEISYNKIDVANITNVSCTNVKNPLNFSFEDGLHKYKFTSADCQLYMDFENKKNKVESWDVTYAENAYSIFSHIADFVNENEKFGILQKFEDNTSAIVESYSWKINVERSSGFNSFYGIGAKMGEEKRINRISKIITKYSVNDELKNCLNKFCCLRNDDEKFVLRDRIMKLVKNNESLYDELKKLLYRPSSEIYIPIPNSKNFHKKHPDFFVNGYGDRANSSSSNFTMVFEPSKTEMECYITQSNGKAIQSCEKQSILGDWLLYKLFHLKEYTPLTENRLIELGINGIRLTKTIDNNKNKIHIQFIWIDEENRPSDFWE